MWNKSDSERPCSECVWNTEDGCSSWSCEPLTRNEIRFIRKRGKWIEKLDKNGIYGNFCSVCNKDNGLSRDSWNWETKFCPNCGAIMQ